LGKKTEAVTVRPSLEKWERRTKGDAVRANFDKEGKKDCPKKKKQKGGKGAVR